VRRTLAAATALLAVTAGLAALPAPAAADEPAVESTLTMAGALRADQPRALRLATPADSFSASHSASGVTVVVHVTGGASYRLELAAPEGQQLAVGTYEHAVVGSAAQPGRPRLDVGGDADSCSGDTGRFEVLDVAYASGLVSRLWATYEQHCRAADPAIVGEVRWHVAAPAVTAAPSRVGFAPAYPGLTQQVPVWLTNNGPSARTLAPAVSGTGFRLVSTTCAALAPGATCAAVVEFAPTTPGAAYAGTLTPGDGVPAVPLAGRAVPGRTKVSIRSDAGDYVGGGGSYDYTPLDSAIAVRVDALAAGDVLRGGAEHLDTNDGFSWSLEPADGQPLTTGTYTDSDPLDSTEPTLNVSGLGRGCNLTAGTFTIHDLAYVPGGPDIERLLVTFDQHCVGSAAHLKGSIAYRAPLGSPDPDITAPPPVAGLTYSVRIDGGVGLYWQPPGGEDDVTYVVRKKAGDKPPSAHTSGTWVYSGPRTWASADDLAPATTYTFAVYAVDAAGNVSAPVVLTLYGSALTVAVTPARALTYGAPVMVTATLTDLAGAPRADVPLWVLWRPAGGTTWQVVDEVRTGADGTATARSYPRSNGDYRVAFFGVAGPALSGQSAPLPVAVATRVTSGLSRTTFALGGGVTLSGSVAPVHAGQRVYLQRRVDGVWQTKTYRVLDAASRYAFAIKPTARGAYEYRVVMPAHTDHARGYGAVRGFTVT
jgi:hypothetical protein